MQCCRLIRCKELLSPEIQQVHKHFSIDNRPVRYLHSVGLIPYSFTVTSHFLITLGLSFSIFIGITIVGFQRYGLHFSKLLITLVSLAKSIT
ncbi:hypothetical protein DVH24_002212 [Malus domestica]|uniref:F-ATPase protein 6 n=1 Tax=Malus domestica TaxID=3750 RepID=A0A498I933_MALDO|nr:hypothetical protein DVH24_002212 [Malus domestica]